MFPTSMLPTYSNIKSNKNIGAFTFSVAIRAHRLHLLHHSWSQLPDHNAHTSTPTSTTFLNSSRLPTLAKAKVKITLLFANQSLKNNNCAFPSPV